MFLLDIYLISLVKILLQMEKHDIHIYDFPSAELESHQQWMRDRLPFAVVGSNTVVMDERGNKCRGREYPWGNVNIENKVGQLLEFLLIISHFFICTGYHMVPRISLIIFLIRDLFTSYSSDHMYYLSWHANTLKSVRK